ncbi:hypothetical protein [Telmatospirillum sp.]|uniref:hypothetical protein n=1 Tax=Telmatospirillum sp. TaxID=2079197 RepID=UPI00285275B6|nr:hypothetical protein [Telmatospirillum sp.]
MQQEFNVAALNCRTVDQTDPNFSSRYNDFVGKFGGKLQENAAALRQHFARAGGGNFDVWMTRVANDAGQRVMADPNFCQQAWDNLDKALTTEPQDIEALAVSAGTSHPYLATCEQAKPKATKTKAAAKKKKSA